MWTLLAACRPEAAPGPRPEAPLTTVDLPPVTVEVPVVTEAPPDDAEGRCGPPFLLATYATLDTSGVQILDPDGATIWAWEVADPALRVLRARVPRDGNGIWVAVGDREIDNGDRGVIHRIGLDGAPISSTETRDPHHDFVELPDGRLAYLAYEFSMPSDGATQQFLATDRIRAVPEGGGVEEVLFSTLSDWTPLPRIDTPPEGLDGRSLPGYLDWGHGASLAYRDSDATLFLMWRWHDTMVAIDDDGVRWAWGGDFADLRGRDSFQHAHFSDLWDGGVFVFDNRRAGPTRLVEYEFDERGYRTVWDWLSDGFERGVGDVRRLEGCDSVMSAWPTTGELLEIDRSGDIVWSIALLAEIERIEPMQTLPF